MSRTMDRNFMELGFLIDKLKYECTTKRGGRYKPHYVKLPLRAFNELHLHRDFIAHVDGTYSFHDLLLCPTPKIISDEEIEVF